MNADVVELPAMRVATVSHRGPYNQISVAFGRLGQLAGAAGLFGPESAMVGIYHDDPTKTPAAELRSEAALVVPANAAIPAGLGEGSIPAGRHARMTHVGPYEGLGAAWSQLTGQWLTHSGHAIRDGVSFEIYRNMPGQVPNDQLITELYLPVT